MLAAERGHWVAGFVTDHFLKPWCYLLFPKLAVFVTLDEAGLVEHCRAALLVEPGNLTDTHAEGEAGPDDGASASACDVVEIVGEHEVILPAELRLDLLFDFSEHFERDHSADAATVESEEFARARFGELIFERWCHGSLVGVMILIIPPRSRTFISKSEVPPGPSPVVFWSQTRSAWIFALSAASIRAVLMIQRLFRA